MKKTVKWGCAAGLLLAMAMVNCSMAAMVDQSQTAYARFDDLGNNAGQTFTAGQDGEFVGIRLWVSGAGYVNGPYGSAIRIDLRTVSTNKVVSSNVLTTGYRTVDGIKHNVPTWIEILFDQPYHQSEGQKLAFTIVGLSGGGSKGWNNYGMISGNPYGGGQQFYSFSTSPLSATTYDMTFETLVVPEPATLFVFSLGVFLMKQRNRNR